MNANVAQNQLQVVDESPANLLALAVQNNASIDHLERLMALKERYDATQAKKHFLSALSNFQKEVPPIHKKKSVGYTGKSGAFVGYKYAEISEIDESIKSAMADNGLTKRWEIKEEDDKIICTCIISHIDGHSETTTMSSIKDASGNKNEIQSRASAVTYLQRYTLIGALGLTTASEDNDGEGTPPATTPPPPDLPWLNVRDRKGTMLPEGQQIINDIKAGKTTLEDLRQQYKLSKAVTDELSQIKVGDAIEPVITPAPSITAADNKPFVIPGHWYAKIEKCNAIEVLYNIFMNNEETIKGTYELQKLFIESYMTLCKTKKDVLLVFNNHKDMINKSAELQGILKAKQNSLSQPVTQ